MAAAAAIVSDFQENILDILLDYATQTKLENLGAVQSIIASLRGTKTLDGDEEGVDKKQGLVFHLAAELKIIAATKEDISVKLQALKTAQSRSVRSADLAKLLFLYWEICRQNVHGDDGQKRRRLEIIRDNIWVPFGGGAKETTRLYQTIAAALDRIDTGTTVTWRAARTAASSGGASGGAGSIYSSSAASRGYGVSGEVRSSGASSGSGGFAVAGRGGAAGGASGGGAAAAAAAMTVVEKSTQAVMIEILLAYAKKKKTKGESGYDNELIDSLIPGLGNLSDKADKEAAIVAIAKHIGIIDTESGTIEALREIRKSSGRSSNIAKVLVMFLRCSTDQDARNQDFIRALSAIRDEIKVAALSPTPKESTDIYEVLHPMILRLTIALQGMSVPAGLEAWPATQLEVVAKILLKICQKKYPEDSRDLGSIIDIFRSIETMKTSHSVFTLADQLGVIKVGDDYDKNVKALYAASKEKSEHGDIARLLCVLFEMLDTEYEVVRSTGAFYRALCEIRDQLQPVDKDEINDRLQILGASCSYIEQFYIRAKRTLAVDDVAQAKLTTEATESTAEKASLKKELAQLRVVCTNLESTKNAEIERLKAIIETPATPPRAVPWGAGMGLARLSPRMAGAAEVSVSERNVTVYRELQGMLLEINSVISRLKCEMRGSTDAPASPVAREADIFASLTEKVKGVVVLLGQLAMAPPGTPIAAVRTTEREMTTEEVDAFIAELTAAEGGARATGALPQGAFFGAVAVGGGGGVAAAPRA